jgi:hypothetical protein
VKSPKKVIRLGEGATDHPAIERSNVRKEKRSVGLNPAEIKIANATTANATRIEIMTDTAAVVTMNLVELGTEHETDEMVLIWKGMSLVEVWVNQAMAETNDKIAVTAP